MRLSLLLPLLLCSCSTLLTAGASGAGAALGSLAGPGGAAIGAAAGVVTVELLETEDPDIVGEGPAATIHETTSLVETIGLWYLVLFVLIPLLTRRGRGWIKGFFKLHDNASQKDVIAQQSRLDTLEESLHTLINNKEK